MYCPLQAISGMNPRAKEKFLRFSYSALMPIVITVIFNLKKIFKQRQQNCRDRDQKSLTLIIERSLSSSVFNSSLASFSCYI